MWLRCSGFEENLDNAVNHFELLRVALREKRINALPDISWIFFSFQEQKSAGGQSKTFGQGSLRSVFEAEFRRLSKFSDPLCE
jgi:hypothetical protein